MPGQLYTNQNEILHWLSRTLLAFVRTKTSQCSKVKRKSDLWSKYKSCKRRTQRSLRSSRWYYLKSKLCEPLEQKYKTMHSYVWMEMVSEHGQLHSDSRCNTEILDYKFGSVFTSEDTYILFILNAYLL